MEIKEKVEEKPLVEERVPTEQELFLKKLWKESSMHKKFELLKEYCEKYELPNSLKRIQESSFTEKTSSELRKIWPYAANMVNIEERPRRVDASFEEGIIPIALLDAMISQGQFVYLDTDNPEGFIQFNKKAKGQILKLSKVEVEKESKKCTIIAVNPKEQEIKFDIPTEIESFPATLFRFIQYGGIKYAPSKEIIADHERRNPPKEEKHEEPSTKEDK